MTAIDTAAIAGVRFDTDEPVELSTVPQHVRRNAQRFGSTVAYRVRHGDSWDELTWSQVYDKVRQRAAGVLEWAGASRGEMPVGYVIGANSPEFFISEYAVQTIGATAFPLFERLTATEMKTTLASYNPTVAFSGSRDATDRLLAAAADINLTHIVQWGGDPLPVDPRVISLEKLEELGATRISRQSVELDQLIDAGKIDDIGCVILTSGTTGTPKGVLGSYRYLLDIAARYRYVYRAQRGDRYLSYLPAAFSVEQYNALTQAAALPLEVAFPASPETVEADLVASRTTMRYLGPRQWEELRAGLAPELLASPERIRAEKTTIRKKLGLEHVRAGVTAGGSMSPDVVEFFRMLDLPISNVYGTAEAGIVSAGEPAHPADSVGMALPSAYGEPLVFRISPEGEVQVHGGARCSGYWGRPIDVTDDGWLKTGDAGELDGGILRVLDRLDYIQKLPDGTVVAPQPIEIKVVESPYISNVILVGGYGDDPRLGALVQINEAAVRRDLDVGSEIAYNDLVVDPRTMDLIRAEFEHLNAALPVSQRIHLIAMMPKPLSSDDGELTRSMKLRRAEVLRRYDTLVEHMYCVHDGEQRETSFIAPVGRDSDLARRDFKTRIAAV